MGITVADVVRPVVSFLGRPSQAALPYKDLIEVTSRKVCEILLVLQNSDRNYNARVVPLNPTSQDVLLNRSGVVVRIESRPVGASEETAWDDWEEADFGDLNSVRGMGYYYSTYGTPTRIAFSQPVTNLEFRAVIESGDVTLAELTDDTSLADVIKPLLFTRVSLEAGARVTDDSDRWDRMWARKERHLRLELPEQVKQFEHFVTARRGQGVQYREGFNSSRWAYGPYEDASGRMRSD